MRIWQVRPVRPEAVLQVGRSAYRGAATTLADGTPVRTGDLILHLHLDNQRLARLRATEGWRSWRLARLLALDLDELARRVAAGDFGEVRALRGVTVFAEAATRLGFEVRPLPRNLASAAVRQISALVIAVYDPHGLESLRRGLPWPGEIWMSRGTLLTRVSRTPSDAGGASGQSGQTGVLGQ
jgi:hypothetical protein